MILNWLKKYCCQLGEILGAEDEGFAIMSACKMKAYVRAYVLESKSWVSVCLPDDF